MCLLWRHISSKETHLLCTRLLSLMNSGTRSKRLLRFNEKSQRLASQRILPMQERNVFPASSFPIADYIPWLNIKHSLKPLPGSGRLSTSTLVGAGCSPWARTTRQTSAQIPPEFFRKILNHDRKIIRTSKACCLLYHSRIFIDQCRARVSRFE